MKALPAGSLRRQLFITHLAAALFSVLVVLVPAGSAAWIQARQDTTDELVQLAGAGRNMLELSQAAGELTDPMAGLQNLLTTDAELSIQLFTANLDPVIELGKPAIDALQPAAAPEIRAALDDPSGFGSAVRRSADGGERVYVAVRLGPGASASILHLSRPLPSGLEIARKHLFLLVFTALLAIVSVGLASWYFGPRLSVQIERLTQAAEAHSRGEMASRVEPAGPAELQRLTLAFNQMADRMQARVEELRIFVPNASHELRTPLTSVRLRAEALLNGALEDPEVATRFLTEIETEVDRLSRMVNDLLDLSRLEAGLITQRRAPLDIGELAAELRDTFRVRAEQARVHIELQIAERLPVVLADEDQIRRVITNLLDNALKFTPADGEIEMRVGPSNGGSHIRFEIRDTGVGIPSRDLPHIFDRFYRVSSTRPRYRGATGSGLGLSITKSIIEMHDGRIGAQSLPGRGTRFWFDLPIRPS